MFSCKENTLDFGERKKVVGIGVVNKSSRRNKADSWPRFEDNKWVDVGR